MKLLDTTIIVGILRGDEDLEGLVEELSGEELATTVLTYFELFSRIYHRDLKREERILRNLLKLMHVLDLDEISADRAAEIMSRLLRAGRPVNAIDVLIAGIALANGVEEVVTRDSDFEVIEKICGQPKVRLLRYRS